MRIYTGDSVTLSIPLRWRGGVFEPGEDWGLIFTAKNDPLDDDADAVIQKATGAGITVAGSTAAVEIVPQDTATLTTATLHCDIQAQEITTGEVRTVWVDELELRRDITRDTTTSIPIYTTDPPYPASSDWSDITGKPSTFTPSAHTHVSADITDAVSGGSADTEGKLLKVGANGTLTMNCQDNTAFGGATNTGTGVQGTAGTTGNGGWFYAQGSGGKHALFGKSGNPQSYVDFDCVHHWVRGAYTGGLTYTGTLTANRLITLPDATGTVSLGENWVFEGDSWTAGTAQGNDRETYPYYLLRSESVRNRVTGYNVATAGQTAATMVSTFSSQVAPYLTATTGKPSTAFIFAGINDSTGSTTTLRNNLRSLWTSARNAGATVVAFTLPHRTAVGGWSQADWLTINTQIIADASYYDHLIRMDMLCSNALASDYTDNLHVSTAAHERIAAAILRILNRGTAFPITTPDLSCNICSTSALSSGVTRRLPFTEVYDANADATTETISGDTNVRVFTVPVDGTYEVSSSVIFGSIVAGDLAYLSIYIIPLATGTAVEHRLGGSFNHAGGVNMGSGGQKRFRLLRGDKVFVGAIGTKTGMTILSNTNFSTFEVRLLSIP